NVGKELAVNVRDVLQRRDRFRLDLLERLDDQRVDRSAGAEPAGRDLGNDDLGPLCDARLLELGKPKQRPEHLAVLLDDAKVLIEVAIQSMLRDQPVARLERL